jgi:hypothetical protein
MTAEGSGPATAAGVHPLLCNTRWDFLPYAPGPVLRHPATVSVFLYDFYPVEQPFELAELRLRAAAEDWLAEAARLAFADGGVGDLHRGEARERHDTLVVPVIWTGSAGGARVGRLDGDLQLAPLNPRRSHLSLSATCGSGVEEDRRLLQRNAEARVREFLSIVVRSLESGVAASRT